AMVFISGHGYNDRNGDYYFLPTDTDIESLKRTSVPYSQIKSTLTSLPGKVLLFLDTCHAGGVMGNRTRAVPGADLSELVNDLVAAENGIVVFASSTKKQFSLENDKWGNGAFTKALIEGISGQADEKNSGKITVSMLEYYIAERVKSLTEGQQTPTTCKPDIIPDFPIAVR
ncbi:MAG: caspase domain-containing protein, partial [Acidobacteriota bacterium]